MNGGLQAVIATPLPGGHRLALRWFDGALRAVDWCEADAELASPRDAALAGVVAQLQHYFAAPHGGVLSLPLSARGTPFQRRVWQALQRIPPGATRSYGELAQELGSSARAVAGACRANPWAVVVPCHRVIGARGAGGYMGRTDGRPMQIKRWLLDHERR